MKIQKLDATFRGQITNLLKDNHLPYLDINPVQQHIRGIFMDNDLIGMAALELYTPYALLRSVIIAKSFQGQGLGSKLVEVMFQEARKLHVGHLFLLTETAEKFFTSHNFHKIDRDLVPNAIKQSEEFKHVCPASAIPMTILLKPS